MLNLITVSKQSMFKGWTIPNLRLGEETLPSRTMLLIEFNREFASYYGKKLTCDDELNRLRKEIIEKFGSFDIEKVIRKITK